MATALCLSTVAEAKEYKGKCLYTNQATTETKFHTCFISPEENSITLHYKREKFQDGNQEIPGTSIIEIASGNYAKRLLTDSGNIVGGIVFSPLGAISSAVGRNYQEYFLTYLPQRHRTDEEAAVVLRLSPSEAPEFQQDLRAVARGMAIRFQDPQKKTIIDIGPDIQDIKKEIKR